MSNQQIAFLPYLENKTSIFSSPLNGRFESFTPSNSTQHISYTSLSATTTVISTINTVLLIKIHLLWMHTRITNILSI